MIRLHGVAESAQQISITLDFANIYTDRRKVGNKFEDTTVSLENLNKYDDEEQNDINIINYKDLNKVYEDTNEAYVAYMCNPNDTTLKDFKNAYIAECEFVDLYDEALVMQALAQMFSNMNEIGWIAMTHPDGYVNYTDASANVTINGDKRVVVERAYRTTSRHNYMGYLVDQFGTSSLYPSGTLYSMSLLDYEGANTQDKNIYKFYGFTEEAKMLEFFRRKFSYWGIQRHEVQVHNLVAYKKQTKAITTTIETKDEDGNVKTEVITEYKPQVTKYKEGKVICFGHRDEDGKFIEVERFYTKGIYKQDYDHTSSAYKNANPNKKVDILPVDANAIDPNTLAEGITIFEAVDMSYNANSTRTSTDYNNNVITPINDITENFSKIFTDDVRNIIETKYTTLSKEVNISDLVKICGGNSTKLTELLNNTIVNSKNVFKYIYGLENVSAEVNKLYGKSVATYSTGSDSIVKSSSVKGYVSSFLNGNSITGADGTSISSPGISQMADKIAVDIDKMLIKSFEKNKANGDVENVYLEDIYGKVYIDDVLIYISNNFDDYYYANIYDDLSKLCNNNDYINGLLAKIDYLSKAKTSVEKDTEAETKYNTYLKNMSYTNLSAIYRKRFFRISEKHNYNRSRRIWGKTYYFNE